MEETAMQLQIKSLIMIEIFIIHLDPFSLYICAAPLESVGSQNRFLYRKHKILCNSFTSRAPGFNSPVAAVLAGLVLTIRSAVTD